MERIPPRSTMVDAGTGRELSPDDPGPDDPLRELLVAADRLCIYLEKVLRSCENAAHMDSTMPIRGYGGGTCGPVTQYRIARAKLTKP